MKIFILFKKFGVLILLFGFILSGCKRFLDETDPSNYTISSYYKNAAEIEQGVVSVYASVYPIYNRQDWMITFLRTGIVDTKFGGDAGYPNFSYVRELGNISDLSNLQTLWNTYFNGIANANQVIKGASNINMNSTQKDKLLGEVYFLRAYYYFELTRIFGAVPLITNPIERLDDPQLTPVRTSLDSVYALIVSDLITAESSGLPFYGEDGRVTLGAVKSLLSTVYLTMAGYPLQKGDEYYKLAADKSEEVINSGAYDLFDSYEFLRNSKLNNKKEYIFEIQFNENDQPNNTLQIGLLPPKTDISAYSLEEGFVFVPDEFVNAFETGDKRVSSFFYDKFTLNKDRNHEIDLGNYYIFKFFDSTAHLSTAKTGLNWPIIRLPEILLNYAEATNEISGPTSKAYDAVNSIRERAGIPALESLTKEEFREAIWRERYFEQCYENKIWYLMTRTRKAFNLTNGQFDDYVGHTFIYGKSLEAKDLLFPIPVNELLNNKNLTPNPGY